MKIKLTENQLNRILTESALEGKNPCNTLKEGKKFCNSLNRVMKPSNSKIRTLSRDAFRHIRDNTDVLGTRMNLQGSEPEYVKRQKSLKEFYKLLKRYNACKKMADRVGVDLTKNLMDKNLSMIVDDNNEYSLLNRIDTHYSAQAYILTLIALDINKQSDFKFYMLDTFIPEQIKEEVLEYIFNGNHITVISNKLKEVLSNDVQTDALIGTLNYSKVTGDKVEEDIKNALIDKGYDVIDFSQDFGFVDYFGIDLVATKDGKLFPIQASSARKSSPKFYEFADDDCPCRAIYKQNGKIRVESPNLHLGESVELLKNKISDIGISDIELIDRFKDEDITDDFLRNLDRKMLKSGDTKENITKYLEKYLKSLEKRQEPQSEPEDSYFVDDDEYQEKSKIGRKQFIKELRPLQVELLKLQEYVKKTGKSVVIVFEGRDSAGKGSTIKKFTEYLQPSHTKVVALGIPNEDERKNWFQRYENQIEPGKIIFFDRSWYNRGIVEPVMGYSSMEEYAEFMENVGDFEQSLLDKGHKVFKFWLSITQDTQRKRFDMRKNSPLKYWKFSPNDEASIDKWDDYTEFKEKALKQTSEVVPWTVVDTNDKRTGALNAIRAVLDKVDYTGKDEKNLGMIYPEVVTTVNEDDEVETEETPNYDFYKGQYNADDKSYIAAYYIGEEKGKMIEVFNMVEHPDNDSYFMDNSKPYSVTTHRTMLPLSQIEFLGDVEGKDGFMFIKLPYWLFKKNQKDLRIQRYNGKKKLYLRKPHRNDEQLERLFSPEFTNYFTQTSHDEEDLKRFEVARTNHQRTKKSINEENSFMRRRVDKIVFRKIVNPRVTVTVEKYPNGQIVDIINPFNVRFPFEIGQVLNRGYETWANTAGYEYSMDGHNYKGGPEKKKFGIPVSMLPTHLKNL